MFCDDIAVVLIDTACGNDPSYARSGIYITVPADHGTRITYTVTTDFNIVSEHCSELLYSGLYIFFTGMYDDELLIGFNIGCNGTRSHMRIISEDTVTYVVIVRCLHMIEKDNILKLYGVTYNTVGSYKSRTSYKSTMSDLSLGADYTRCSEIRRRKDLCSLMHPHIL